MRYSHSLYQNSDKAVLYRVVFDLRAVRYVAGLVFMFFLLHPVVPAFASEDVSVMDTNQDTPAQELEAVQDHAPEIVPATQSRPEEIVTSEPSMEPGAPDTNIAEDIQTTNVISDGVATENTAASAVMDSSDTISSHSQELVEVDTEVLTNTDSVEFVEGDVGGGTGATSSQEDLLPEETAEVSTSTITKDIVEPVLHDVASDVVATVNATGTQKFTNNSQEEENASTSLATLSQLLASSTDIQQEPAAQVAGVATSTNITNVPEVEELDVVTSDEGDDSQKEDVADETSVNKSEQMDNSEEEATITDISLEESDQEPATTTQDTQIATTTPPVEVPLPQEINTVTNNLNAYQFADKECVSVGDGSFYCSEIDGAPEYVEDGVFSAPDNDGDTEIYVTINGETTQITNNLTDDASPYYDGISNTIVWHSMKNDRFQIAQYDVETGEITYLTNASYNNMEPVAYGSLVLWQAWIGNNWEIMLLNNGTLTQLTNNKMHDITPQIRDGYIMWQTQFAEGWKIALYDTRTKKVKYIADSDGSEVANPRFVLVYDSTDKVGDVQTLGYDFGSGSSFVLGSLPAEIPEQIPQPDQTGETRALIQAKPATREGEVEEVIPTSSGTGSSTPPTNTTSSSSISTQDGDLIIEPIAASNTQDTINNEMAPTEKNTDSTDVLEIPVQATSTDTTHIEDVVIPPFSTTTTEEIG